MRNNDGSAEIGEVGAGIETAIILTDISIVTALIGVILIIIGGIKTYHQNKLQN